MTSGGASRSVRSWAMFVSTRRREQLLRESSCREHPLVEVEAGPEPAAADRGDAVPEELTYPRVQVGAEARAASLVLAGAEHRDHLAPDRARERIAAERAPVRPGREHPEHVARTRPPPRAARSHRPAPCPPRRGRAGPPRDRTRRCGRCVRAPTGSRRRRTGRRARCRAGGRRGGSPSGGTTTPASPWIGSRSTATVVSVTRVGERAGVAEGHRHEPGGERAEPGPGSGVAREAGDGRRAPVEVAGAHDDRRLVGGDALDRVPPSPDHLDRGFHRFGAGVHGHDHLHAAELGEVAAERFEHRRSRRRGSVSVSCVSCRRAVATQPGVAVPEVQRGVRGEEIEVPASVVVLDPGAASRAVSVTGSGS